MHIQFKSTVPNIMYNLIINSFNNQIFQYNQPIYIYEDNEKMMNMYLIINQYKEMHLYYGIMSILITNHLCFDLNGVTIQFDYNIIDNLNLCKMYISTSSQLKNKMKENIIYFKLNKDKILTTINN